LTLAFFLDFLKTTSLTTYSYDRNGSIISEEEEGRKSEYRYDLLNRQTYVKTLDGKEQENFYDGEGLRAGLTENGKKTTFLFHNGEILTECEGESAPIRRYVRGLGLSHVQTEDGVYHAYYQDEQGSTAYITGNNGNVENCYLYDSFGNVMESRESIANRILYTGQQYDQETGQYYLRARYYNPVIGRFTQEDTYRGDGLNLYAYCGNNPVMYYDPSGHNQDEYKVAETTKPEQQKTAGEDGSGFKGDSYSYKNGTYDKADYHSGQTTGRKNPAPKDGQFALDNSVSIGENTARRIGLDSNGDFVVLDKTSSGVFHGHTRAWKAEGGNQGLTQEMKNALCDASFIKSPTGSKFKLTDYAKSLIRD